MAALKVQNQGTVKANNCRMILRLLRDNRNRTISRADLAKETGMSPTSITRLIRDLLDMKLVRQEEPFSNGVGRNGIQVILNADAFYSAGISLDSDYVKVCIVNLLDEVLIEKEEMLEAKSYSPEEVLLIAKRLLEKAREEQGIERSRIKALGVASVGNVDQKRGFVHFASQMGWFNIDLANKVRLIFDLDPFIDNDVKMALLGATYQFPDLRNSDSAYISVGAGIGAAVMYDGKMLRGYNNAVGEVGHVHFAMNGGRVCSCGRKDCSYTYISTAGLMQLCREKGHPVNGIEEFVNDLKQGSVYTEEVIEQYTNDLSIFLSDMIYIYNPKYLLVGGTVISAHPVFFEQVEQKLRNSIIHTNLLMDVIVKKRELTYNAALGGACGASERKVLEMIDEFDASL